jgi:hypothetical protein
MLVITICRTMVSQHERMYNILVQQDEKLQRLGRQVYPVLNRGRHLSEKTPPTSGRDARYELNLTEPVLEARADGPLLHMGIIALNNYEVDAFEELCIFSGLAFM